MSVLNHPCIVTLFQSMQLADNVYYLVTELIAGGDLCSFIIGQRHGKLDERSARIYARQFVSALAHMHSFGVVHRDLKMENVMLNAAQTQIKIVDFGLSNVWTSDNPLRTHCGSPEYAAPELFVAGREYGPEVDLWSLGIILYGMVVGQLPFVTTRGNHISSQERRKKLVAQINKGLGSSQRQALSTLSQEFRVMLNKLLSADSIKRIGIKELIVHPWITERGRKIIHAHPIRKLDPQWQAKLTRQISDLYGMDHKKMSAEIAKNPYGKFAGIYNILTFKYFTEQFGPSCIVSLAQRNTGEKQKVENNNICNKADLCNYYNKAKSAPPRRNHDLYNQCVAALDRMAGKVSEKEDPQQQQQLQRPKTGIREATFTRNVVHFTRSKAREMLSAPTQIKLDPVLALKQLPEEILANPVKKSLSSRIQSATVTEKSRTKSDPTTSSNSKRPCTAATRQRSPQKNLQRTSTSPESPTKNQESLKKIYLEKITTGMGDSIPKRSWPYPVIYQKFKGKSPPIQEPIARRIADYVVKNVPEKIFNVMQK